MRVGLMPGSRSREIKRNLPVILEVIDRIKAEHKELQFSIILREKIDPPQTLHSTIYRVYNDRYQAMKNCDLLITCSGTASLEAAFLGIPQVFFNRPSWVDFNLMRHFISIKELNLANLYFGRKIVPAYIDRRLDRLYRAVSDEILKIYHSQTGLE
jgi:lipid-A-disaccharide synthase